MKAERPFNFRTWLITGLRRMHYRFRPRSEALKEARVFRGRYACALCKQIVGRKEIQIDHIEPVVDTTQGFVSWDEYIPRMFCEKKGYQVLCKPCHKGKTKEENMKRREARGQHRQENSVYKPRTRRKDSKHGAV